MVYIAGKIRSVLEFGRMNVSCVNAGCNIQNNLRSGKLRGRKLVSEW